MDFRKAFDSVSHVEILWEIRCPSELCPPFICPPGRYSPVNSVSLDNIHW